MTPTGYILCRPHPTIEGGLIDDWDGTVHSTRDAAQDELAEAHERDLTEYAVFEVRPLEAPADLCERVARWLAAARGRRFAVATARPELRRLLDRAGYGLRSLGLADPARLAEDASDWGSYYDARPEVFAG